MAFTLLKKVLFSTIVPAAIPVVALNPEPQSNTTLLCISNTVVELSTLIPSVLAELLPSIKQFLIIILPALPPVDPSKETPTLVFPDFR